MKRIKRAAALLLAAVLFTAVLPAMAKDWVTVSSWAYNDVSNFTKEGLLPESFDDITDYRQNITRLQFAELVYSVINKTKDFDERYFSHYAYQDTDSYAAAALASEGIMFGETAEGEDITSRIYYTDSEYRFFRPDRTLTREEMAAIIYRIVKNYCNYLLTENNESQIAFGRAVEPSAAKDFYEISDWAQTSVEQTVKAGIISGMTDGTFRPKENLSIEQAMSVMYRIYNSLPTAPSADGSYIRTDEEQTVQIYANGVEETKKGHALYLKNGGDVIGEFDTDIYSNIYCATSDGKIYAAAQTLYGTTDIYDLEENKILSKITYPTYSADSEYIIVKSENIGPFKFGLYSYNGNEILAPLYSMGEIDEIRANEMKIPEDKKQKASGWIYYSNVDDGGKLYRVDSNGENKQKLSDHYCSGIEYINGWLFYHTFDDDKTKRWTENPLYCMKADGTQEQRLTGNGAKLCDGHWYTLKPDNGSSDGYWFQYGGSRDRYGYGVTPYTIVKEKLLCHDDEWIYYFEVSDTGYSFLRRVSVKGDKVRKENVSGDLYATGVQYKDGIVYFTGFNDEVEKPMSLHMSLYCFDGEKLTKLSGDLNIMSYGFKNGMLQLASVEGVDEDGAISERVYYAGMDGSGLESDNEIAAARKQFEEIHDETGRVKNDRHIKEIQPLTSMSDEQYSIYNIFEWTQRADYDDEDYVSEITETLMLRDAEGNESVLDVPEPLLRIGNVLYYVDNASTAEKANHIFIAYDLDTGESRIIADNVKTINYDNCVAGDNWFTWTDYSFNIRRYNVKNDAVTEISPNNNLHKYGKVHRMLGTDTGMYKVDEDGNYSFIMGETAADCIYVENGASDAVHF